MSGLSTGTAYCKIKVKMWCSNITIGFYPLAPLMHIKKAFQSKCWKLVCFPCWRRKDVIYTLVFILACIFLPCASTSSSLWASARVEHLHRHVMGTLQRSEEILSMFVSFSIRKSKVVFWGGKSDQKRTEIWKITPFLILWKVPVCVIIFV